jgi:hypothetical protein
MLVRLKYNSLGFSIFRWGGFILFTTGISLSLLFSDGYSRDKDKIKDTHSILKVIPKGDIININPAMYNDWSLHGYFARFKNVSLDPELKNERDYLLIKNELYADSLSSKYEIVKTNSMNYMLFRKK